MQWTISDRWTTIKPWSRHALTLSVAGIAYILFGISLSIREDVPARPELMSMAFHIMGDFGWGISFIVVGLVVTISARWPILTWPIGYALLTGWTCVWAGLNLSGGIMNGAGSYVTNGLMWAVIAILWWAVSGFVNPPEVRGTTHYGLDTTTGYPPGSYDRSNLCLLDAETRCPSPTPFDPRDSSNGDGG